MQLGSMQRHSTVSRKWQQGWQQQQQCRPPQKIQQRRSAAAAGRNDTVFQCFTVHQRQQQPALPRVTSGLSSPARPGHVTAAVASLQAADPCLELVGLQSRAVGSLLGAMCGNALGAQVEPEKHYRMSRMFPDGLHDMSWTFDISSSPLPPGHVTGDYVIMAAVSQSLVRCGAAEALDMADCMAACYDDSAAEQWYSPYNKLMLEGLAAGSNPFMLAKHAEGYLASTASRASNTASHRPGRQLHGMSDFSALSRVIPVAVAYREAPLQVLRQASDAAVLFTHPSDTAADAAAVLAAAVAWCIRSDASSSSPSQLLDHLHQDVATTEDMRQKLQLLQERLPALAGLDKIDDWSVFWRSQHWGVMTAVANLLTKQNLAVEAPQAAVLALWVMAASWRHPQQAIMLAASLGGYAATTGALVGGLAGALHGCSWVPAAWWEQLQDEPPQDEHEAAGQPGQHKEQLQQHKEAEAEAAEGSEQAMAEQQDELIYYEWQLRPVSKYSVCVLGHQLAELDCRQTVALL